MKTLDPKHPAWKEYDAAAEWCAKLGYAGRDGDPLPSNMSVESVALINADPESFERRVKDYAYALAMNKTK
jgi:hypothetical protein